MRDQLIQALQREVIGPDPHTQYLDPDTNEEVLLDKVHGAPWVRYGAGMLYPQGKSFETEADSGSDSSESTASDSPVELNGDPSASGNAGSGAETDTTEEPVGLAYQYKPSAMGFTASFSTSNTSAVVRITVRSAWYEQVTNRQFEEKKLTKEGEIVGRVSHGSLVKRKYWVRRPIPEFSIEYPVSALSNRGSVAEEFVPIPGATSEWLKLGVFNRSTKYDDRDGLITLTFTLTNCKLYRDSFDNSEILYQNELSVVTEKGVIQPYREKISTVDTEEEEELRLLYRKKRVYGIGHGCSVEWKADVDGNVERISSSFLPVYEIPPVDPTQHVELAMYDLSDLGDWGKAKENLCRLRDEYGAWIDGPGGLDSMADSLPDMYKNAAKKNIAKCRETHRRISRGVELLIDANDTDNLVRCFRWMNHAMLWQQQRSKAPQRKWVTNKNSIELPPLPGGLTQHESLLDFHKSSTSERPKGRWRPFQLAFILMNLEGIWNESSEERGLVDLIWFPTGGGKTEAYLGLTALTVFARRIRGSETRNFAPQSGTAILMRYTLRLLTTQQYERAASLICACELIRKKNQKFLGPDTISPNRTSNRISIGLWVGGDSTPNDRERAVSQYCALTAEKNSKAEYNFIVMKCPCCGAQIGRIDKPTSTVKVRGIHRTDGKGARVFFRCDNSECEFHLQELPLYVVDEDIYEYSPTLLLGTVDKFAMIPWKLESGSIFGFREHEDIISRVTPPELIVQDELHLISGPLGTVVGLYETLIQTLCTNFGRTHGPFFLQQDLNQGRPPKIVASSATISRAAEQVKALYASHRLHIFPSQGLDFGDTWFSKEMPIDADNPGRRYVGVLAPGYQSGQTTVVRTYSPILQKVKSIAARPDEKDYYWTLLGFFNSIRELGMASSLIYADVSEYLTVLQNRNLIDRSDSRRYLQLKELTSRINSSQIPQALKELEKSYGGEASKSIDVCLATNMIATGLDVPRLGLMYIHGQPKTTAEYIQASSRVGRTKQGPGLVVMLYSPNKPRDKSIYEQFQAYHSRIYAHVEPTSVTPFSIDARKRALHAVLIGLMRHFANDDLRKSPVLDLKGNLHHRSLYEWVSGVIRERVTLLDSEELKNTVLQIEKIVSRWQNGFQRYGDAANMQIKKHRIVPLMYAPGTDVPDEVVNKSLLTPTTMRGVDEEVYVSIYNPN
ncbi:helicase-related protein [Rudanella lutea]|uniref:helicase-related protein n=1 Tax=Rudanella lutea TaxID=451374 RepID=UPI00036FCAFB|nr:helicase-related protein [Rudanella lutea]